MYLNTHTYYSLCYGTINVSQLLNLALNNQCESIALTDINSTSACVDFVRQAKKTTLKPVIGIDFRNGVEQQFIAIARNNQGFEEMNRFLSDLLGSGENCPSKAPDFEHVFIIYPFQKLIHYDLKPYEFIGVRSSDLPYIRLKQLSTEKAVILHPVSFQSKKDFNAHRLLRAIDNNLLLSKLPVSEQGEVHHQMLPVDELLLVFQEFPQIIQNTQFIFNASSVDFDFSPERSENQQCYSGSKEKDWELLKNLCEEGLPYRYPAMTDQIRQRIESELKTIQQMNFVSYFLINWDIVSYAISKGYYHVGRGSGANSIVAYLLKITDVDPIELDLYFERFINLFRVNPPDFDIDFAWTDRDDVMRYIFERFPNVALVATYNTFSDKSALRELGKVFGLPKEEIDQLTRSQYDLKKRNHLSDLVLKYSDYIKGFPSHLSIHASGIVISEKPIHYFSATFFSQKAYKTIQFDMHTAEDMGWYKFDILSQRGLSKIKDSIEIIRYNQPEIPEFDVHDIQRFKQDERIKSLLREADAVGCFYVESPAMRMLLRKLQVDNYIGLVAASSVIRPGVAKSGMMNAYIQRFRNPEKRKEAHPVLLELMPETFGVMVYQEDVIKVAHYFAGLTLGEADKMRRGMSGKFRSREEFSAVKQQFFDNCIHKNGHSLEVTAEVWRQTESFAGYAFAKGHSASYAVESYQCLFLKAYFPLEFLVATINNYGGFYSTELYVLEAKRLGAIIESICVNNSEINTCIQKNVIFLGYHLLSSLEGKIAKAVAKERALHGPFLDLENFIQRNHISLEQITLLIRINAFRFTGKNKKELLWEAHMRINPSAKEVSTQKLFEVKTQTYKIPALINTQQEDLFDQLDLLGFTIDPYFSLVTNGLTENYVLSRDLQQMHGMNVWIKGYLIHAKNTTTSQGHRMAFGTFIDEEGNWLDTVHFPEIIQRFPFRGRGVYKVFGKVIVEYDCVIIETAYLEKLGIIEDPRYADVKKQPENDALETSNLHTHFFSRARK